jgi:hypothetical protein
MPSGGSTPKAFSVVTLEVAKLMYYLREIAAQQIHCGRRIAF